MNLPVTWAGPKDYGKVHPAGPERAVEGLKYDVRSETDHLA